MTRARPFDTAGAVPRPYDAGGIGRTTWLGLAVAALGWMALLVAMAFPDAAPTGSAYANRFHADLAEAAKCLIASGFALAVIGTLQVGFGALNRFFTAALDRSSTRHAQGTTAAPARPDETMATPPRRPYSILSDGSVEVETILGTRRFADMGEAREFI